VKLAWLVLAVGCWSAPAATPRPKPEPVTPPADPRAGAQLVKADPLERRDDLSPFTAKDTIELREPWTLIETGWSGDSYQLLLEAGREKYVLGLSDGGDGTFSHSLALHDIVPGGAPEILVVVENVADGGKWVSVVVCGVGPSKVPSCARTSIGKAMFDLNDESYKVVTPRSGGVELVWEGKHQKLWFEFP
jgi:hypothetical protein